MENQIFQTISGYRKTSDDNDHNDNIGCLKFRRQMDKIRRNEENLDKNVTLYVPSGFRNEAKRNGALYDDKIDKWVTNRKDKINFQMLVDTYHEDNFDFILRTKKTTRKLKTFTQQDRIDIEQHNKDCKIIELEKAKDIQKTKQGSWSHMDDINFNCNYIFDTKIDNPMDSDNDEDDIKAKILKNFSKTKIVTPKVIILSKTPVIKKAVIVDDVDKVFLFVPFQFKDDAKKNGAKWDLIHKKWYTYLGDE